MNLGSYSSSIGFSSLFSQLASMESHGRHKTLLLFFLVLLVAHNVVTPAMSRNLEFSDQKTYYSPKTGSSPKSSHKKPACFTPSDGGSSAPSHGSGGSYGTPTVPSHGSGGSYGPPTPSHGSGGSYGRSPTPSHGSGGSYGTPTPSHRSGGSYGSSPAPSHGSGGSYGSPTPSHGSGGSYGPPTPSHGSGGSYGPPTPSHGSGSSYGRSPTPSQGSGGSSSSPTPIGGYYISPPSCGSHSSPPVISPPSIPVVEPTPATPTPTTPAISTPSTPYTDPHSYIGTCTYWGSHPDAIVAIAGYWGTISSIFGAACIAIFGKDLSLQDALKNTRSDGYGALFREGTASLLNAMVNSKFPFTPQQVKRAFDAAITSDGSAAAQATLFQQANEGNFKIKF